MSAIFLSHSSRDAAATQMVKDALAGRGYQSIFLDYDPADGIPAGREWAFAPCPPKVELVAFDPKGTRVALAAGPGSLRLFDVHATDGAVAVTPSGSAFATGAPLQDDPTPVSLIWNRSGTSLIVRTEAGIDVFDARTRALIKHVALRPGESPKLMTTSADDRWLLVYSRDGGVTPIATQTWQPRPPIELDSPLAGLGVSSDGRRLVTNTPYRALSHNRHVLGRTEVWALDGDTSKPIAWRAFDSDGQAVSQRVDGGPPTSGGDQRIVDEADHWPGGEPPEDVRSPDEDWVISTDGLVHRKSGRSLKLGGSSKIGPAAFSAAGQWLATVDEKDTLKIWSLSADQLIADWCARAARNLSRSEWKVHFDSPAYRPTCPTLPFDSD